MRKMLLLAVAMMVSFTLSAQLDTLKYRIVLTDKDNSIFSIDKPEEFLTKKAIERRIKQGLSIDESDLPVNASYINAIKECGVSIVTKGKWENFVTVSCNDPLAIDKIKDLAFVASVEKVWFASEKDHNPEVLTRDSLVNEMKRCDSYYGASLEQIQLCNADKLHEEGFKGEGMTIAVIDAGYHNVDVIDGMDNVKILGTKDFVNSNSDIYEENGHGTSVLSCMAMNKPHYMIGTAPQAEYWLLRSEDESTEHLVEQDYWAAAVEFADSVGVDVVNTSLGYHEFDDISKNYTYNQLDGKHALMSRQAARMADKGMVLVCSAGNSGAGSWKKTTAPGDADNIITVGAVNSEGTLAPFSSIGNTADNRIKPDVVSVGWETDVMGTDGVVRKANGTSFSSPVLCGMVACLWQACPELTAKQIVQLIQQSGDRFDSPDNIYGYGIPNVWNAYQTVNKKK